MQSKVMRFIGVALLVAVVMFITTVLTEWLISLVKGTPFDIASWFTLRHIGSYISSGIAIGILSQFVWNRKKSGKSENTD
jgi:ABC-type transport system involved in multi-copper enzyme maturation permease subunit